MKNLCRLTWSHRGNYFFYGCIYGTINPSNKITGGVGTRYIQGYLDFLLLKKQAKYTFKRKEMAAEILRMIIDTEAFSNEMVRATPMPISLKEANYEYRYGIFAE